MKEKYLLNIDYLSVISQFFLNEKLFIKTLSIGLVKLKFPKWYQGIYYFLQTY